MGVRPCNIKVRIPDRYHKGKGYEDTIIHVEAHCVGGDEGIFAIYEHPDHKQTLCIAFGDDGYWQEKWQFNEHWLTDIINALGSKL